MSSKRIEKGKESKTARARESNLDLDPNAWPRFEALVKSAAKIGHRPHVPKQAKKTS